MTRLLLYSSYPKLVQILYSQAWRSLKKEIAFKPWLIIYKPTRKLCLIEKTSQKSNYIFYPNCKLYFGIGKHSIHHDTLITITKLANFKSKNNNVYLPSFHAYQNLNTNIKQYVPYLQTPTHSLLSSPVHYCIL